MIRPNSTTYKQDTVTYHCVYDRTVQHTTRIQSRTTACTIEEYNIQTGYSHVSLRVRPNSTTYKQDTVTYHCVYDRTVQHTNRIQSRTTACTTKQYNIQTGYSHVSLRVRPNSTTYKQDTVTYHCVYDQTVQHTNRIQSRITACTTKQYNIQTGYSHVSLRVRPNSITYKQDTVTYHCVYDRTVQHTTRIQSRTTACTIEEYNIQTGYSHVSLRVRPNSTTYKQDTVTYHCVYDQTVQHTNRIQSRITACTTKQYNIQTGYSHVSLRVRPNSTTYKQDTVTYHCVYDQTVQHTNRIQSRITACTTKQNNIQTGYSHVPLRVRPNSSTYNQDTVTYHCVYNRRV